MSFFERPTIAVMLLALGMAIIPLNDAFLKLMSARLPLFELVAIRSSFALVVTFLIPGTFISLAGLSIKTWLKLLGRGLCLVSSMMLYFLSLSSLSLAETTSIFFICPLLITLLSVPILGEKIGPLRLFCVLFGLAGVLVIVRPGIQEFEYAYLLAIGSAVSYALFQIITRYLRDEAALLPMVTAQQIMYFMFAVIIGGVLSSLSLPHYDDPTLAFLLRNWTMPTGKEVGFLLACSLIILFLSYASTNAYRNAEATFVAPFEYTAMPMAIIWGVVFWGDWPDFYAWIGMIMIVGSGIFMIYRENKRDTEIASSVPMRAAATNSALEEEEAQGRDI